LRGKGARLTQVAFDAGCTLLLVRVWADADRKTERKLKNRHSPRLCPICTGLPVQLPLLCWMPAYVPQVEPDEEVDPTRADGSPEYTAAFEALAQADELVDDILDRAFWARGDW
jgi:hypothetical protein